MPILETYRVKYTQKAVSSYSIEELKALFAAATAEEYELFQFFLCTGAREQEITYTTWPDLDFHRKTFKASEKLDLGFPPKDKEEGAIPLPDDFVELMWVCKSRLKTRLIFPGVDGKPNGHFLPS